MAPRYTLASSRRWSEDTKMRDTIVEEVRKARDDLDPQEDDTLIDELLASNPKSQALVTRSKAGPRKPFAGGKPRPAAKSERRPHDR